MFRITCDYCFEDHFFELENDRPESCKNCNSPLGHLAVENTLEEEASAIRSLNDEFGGAITLTYQKTGEQIEIPHSEIIILGRQNTGRELFEKIPQISREHCKIEFINGQYLVTDLNSMNGTFIGNNQRDCLKHKKELLTDNVVLYLGREAFLVSISILVSTSQQSSYDNDLTDEFNSLRFKCKACGKIHDMNLMICDACGSYGQIEPLEK